MNKVVSIIILFIGIVLSACSKKEVPEYSNLLGLDYYSLTIGKFVIYEADSTVYTEIPRDTLVFKFQIREKITDAFTDETGTQAYRLERSVRIFDPLKAYNQLPWRLRDVAVIRANDKRIELQDNNIRFTRLIFPIQENASWNCNSTNTLSEQFCRYENIELPQVFNQVSIEKTLVVKQLEDVNLIEGELASEQYGKVIGLLSKEHIHVKGNKVEAGKTVFQRIESGFIYKQTFLSHGVE